MNGNPGQIALIFDFDDTLAPDTTIALLEEYKIHPDVFWADVRKMVSAGFDPTLAYLQLLLSNVGKDKPLGMLTNKELRKFGKRRSKTIFEHLPTLFRDLRKEVAKAGNIDIDFYIISGGLTEIIRGFDIVNKNFSFVYGCELAGDSENDILKYIKRSVTFTEKTRYLFEINKGIKGSESLTNPYLVNKEVKQEKRPVPMTNMIYVGDGLTDIPCFSTLTLFGGTPFGVFDPKKPKTAKQAFQDLLKTRRVLGLHRPRYGKNDDFGSLLRITVAGLCSDILVAASKAR